MTTLTTVEPEQQVCIVDGVNLIRKMGRTLIVSDINKTNIFYTIIDIRRIEKFCKKCLESIHQKLGKNCIIILRRKRWNKL